MRKKMGWKVKKLVKMRKDQNKRVKNWKTPVASISVCKKQKLLLSFNQERKDHRQRILNHKS